MNDNSINIDYNKYYTETLSSSQMSDIRERHNTEDMLQNLAVTGGVVGLGTYGYNRAKKNNKVLEMVENLPGAKLLTERLQNGYQGAEYIQPPNSGGGPQPLSRSLHSMLLAAEEASPLHIAKTLGLSSFQTLFVEVVDQEKQTIKIGSDSIRAYSEYYRNLVLNSSGYALTRKDIQNGFLLEDNKLFLANKDGTKGREIAGYARIISTNTTIGHQDSPNRVFQKFANIMGVDVHVSQFKQEPLAIVAGANKAQVMQDWSRAYARFGTEIGFKVLDNPLGFVEEMFGNLGVDTQNSKLFNNKFVTTFKKHINLGLGADGVYNKGNREAMKIMAKNLGIKAIGAYTSYVSVNHFLEKITGEDNPWHNGIGAGITDMYAKMRVGFAKVWSDNLQSIREEQEEAAPESTSLISLAALPLGGAMLGANIAYFKRMRDIASKGFDEGARINTEIKKFDGTIGKILDKVKFNPEGTTLARYGKLGALAGAALTIPFLPGALVGRSSEELKAEFEGTSDVAVRRNRGWLFGSEAYEGGQIKYHRKSLVRELVTDARNKTLYKDGDQQRDMDPLASPFEYLKNPYAFEEAHQHDMPYAVWGMDVTYGSFMGKIFQGTVGQLIKPTVVNPELEKHVQNVEQRLEGELSTTKSLTGTVIKKGEAPVKAAVGTSEEDEDILYTRGDQIAIPVKESRKDASMQKDGMMLSQSSATVDPTKEAMVDAYAAFSDFTGLKGFTSSSVMDAIGLDPTDQTAPKLAVSGSANTLVDRYQSMQLGDAMGCFTKDNYVFWEDGYISIDKVQVGYKLLSKDGKLRTVSKIYSKEVNEEILKTVLEDDTIIYSTTNHVFPGYKNNSLVLEEKAIVLWEEGDKLIQQVPLEAPRKLSIVSQELIWYKGTVYDLEMSEGPDRASTKYTHYYTVQDILCHNSGEFIRRLLPQSADTRREEVNPMRNSIAPSWLPRDPGRDFGEGNYYCLAPWSLVEVDGIHFKQAKDVVVGDKLLGKEGTESEVKRVSVLPGDEVYKIVINGAKSVPTYVTKEHPIAVKIKKEGKHKQFRLTDLERAVLFGKSVQKGCTVTKVELSKILKASSYSTLSLWIKKLEKEGYIITGDKTVTRTFKDSPDEYLLSKGIEFKLAGQLKVGDYVAYPKVKKCDTIERLDVKDIPTSYDLVFTDNYVYPNRCYESALAVEYLLNETNINPNNPYISQERERIFSTDLRKTRKKRYYDLDKKFGLFCGIWLAEGWCGGSAHHRKEKNFIKEIYENNELSYSVYQVCDNGIVFRYSDKVLDSVLVYLFGKGAKTKHLNPIIYKAPDSFIEGLVEGYFFGDGTITNSNGRYAETAASASPVLLKQLKLLMVKRLGIVTTVYDYTPKTDENSLIKNGGYINFLVKRRQDGKCTMWSQDEDFFYFRVNEISKEYCDKVYAFETSDSTFCTYSMLTHNSKHEAGYTMLPGSRGFEALHPELRGVDPENYSDAWKYRILQNVARGSKEHYTYRDKLIKEVDTLSDYDKNIFFTAYEQDMARSEEKKFFEYKTEEDKAKMNLLQLAQNTLWESVSHLESPTEPLTPFRPMAKFLHQRTAIEDYRRTQLAGSDAAIWTKPIDHFINPTINRHIQLFDEFYKPRDVKEKESIDEYFDNLKLVKASQGRPYDAKNTIVGAAYSGMRTRDEMEAFKRALPDNQKAYVESFASERDEKKRAEILEMLPSNIGRVYSSIWANIDEYDKAVSSGQDPNERLRVLYLRETEILKKETGITLTRQEIEGINKASYKIRDREERENFIAEEQAAKVRAKAAQQEAQAYVEEVTGTPDSSWIGWDKRLTIDDIKLKTLSVGKEDITRFGYWSKEQQRNDRIVALDNDTQVVNRLKEIKKELRDNQDNKHLLKRRLREQGYEVHDISTTPGAGSVNINNDQ